MKKIFIIFICLIILSPHFVFATENLNTNFNITIDELTFVDNKFGNTNYTFREVFQHINEIETSNYYVITLSFSNRTFAITNITLWLFESSPLYQFSTYMTGSGSSRQFYYLYNSSTIKKTGSYNVFNQSTLDTIYGCIESYSNCSLNERSGSAISYFYPDNTSSASNDSDFAIDFPPEDINSYGTTNFPMLSNFGIIHSEGNCANSNYLCKKLVVNEHVINDGGYVPTYFDLYDLYTTPDTPVDPDEPTSSSHTSWIYWFDSPSDTNSYLNNIYTLLFLYCITMIIFKVYYTIKDKN